MNKQENLKKGYRPLFTFTSTAVIAKQEGKPSVYYDPSGVIQKNNRAAHDIPVLSGINELEDWVNSIDNKVN